MRIILDEACRNDLKVIRRSLLILDHWAENTIRLGATSLSQQRFFSLQATKDNIRRCYPRSNDNGLGWRLGKLVEASPETEVETESVSKILRSLSCLIEDIANPDSDIRDIDQAAGGTQPLASGGKAYTAAVEMRDAITRVNAKLTELDALQQTEPKTEPTQVRKF
jgi:hypothetical protein